MQGFRTLELSEPSELHMDNGILQIRQEERTITVPAEDLTTIVCIGPNIRISTMALSVLASHGVFVMALDTSYRPACIVSPVDSNAKQALVMHRQVSADKKVCDRIWLSVIRAKIENQAEALSILGLPGVEKVAGYCDRLETAAIDNIEAAAAREYFLNYRPGLNRRNNDPVNSRLNYGY